MLTIIVVALLAFIASLKGLRWLSLGLVLVLGAMLAGSPGLLGQIVGGAAGFFRDLPTYLAGIA